MSWTSLSSALMATEGNTVFVAVQSILQPKFRQMAYTDSMKSDSLLLCAVLALIGVISLVGNLLLLRTFFSHPKSHTALYFVFGALSIADLLYTVIVIPIDILHRSRHFDLITESLCKPTMYLAFACGYMPPYLILLLCIFRAIFLTSRSFDSVRQWHGLCACFLICLLCLLANIPMLDVGYFDFGQLCVIPFQLIFVDEQLLLLVLSFAYIIPVFLMFFVYILTYMISRRYQEGTYTSEQTTVSRLVTTLVVTYLLIWFPAHVLTVSTFYKAQSVSTWEEQYRFERLLTATSFLWAFAQADKCVRPVILANMSHIFSVSFDEVIDCKLCRKSPAPSPVMSNDVDMVTSADRLTENGRIQETDQEEIV